MSQTEHDRRIDYIELPTIGMDKMKSFYSGAFGWSFTDYGPDYASFKDGRLAGGFSVARKPASGGGPLVVLYAVDLEQVAAAVETNGGTITTPPFEFPGGRRFHFSDPSGNELAVWSER